MSGGCLGVSQGLGDVCVCLVVSVGVWGVSGRCLWGCLRGVWESGGVLLECSAVRVLSGGCLVMSGWCFIHFFTSRHLVPPPTVGQHMAGITHRDINP